MYTQSMFDTNGQMSMRQVRLASRLRGASLGSLENHMCNK